MGFILRTTSEVSAYRMYRAMCGERSWTLALCSKGKATPGIWAHTHIHTRIHIRTRERAISLLAIPTAADLLQLVRYRPEKPAPTSSCRFVGKHWNAKVVRTCLADQPARSAPRAAAAAAAATGRLRSALLVHLLQPRRSSWNPGICRRPFKIRLTP